MAVVTKNKRKGPAACVKLPWPSQAASPACTAQAVLQGWEPLLWTLRGHWVSAPGRPLPQSLTLTEGLAETFSFLCWQWPTLPCLDVYSCHWRPQGAEGSPSKASMVGHHEGASTHSYFLNLLSIREWPGHWFVHGKNINRELLVHCFFPAFAYC